MCDCNAPFVITGFTYELINKYDKVKTKVVDGACCSECLENIVIPQLTPEQFYSTFGKSE